LATICCFFSGQVKQCSETGSKRRNKVKNVYQTKRALILKSEQDSSPQVLAPHKAESASSDIDIDGHETEYTDGDNDEDYTMS
jgi:hypothetical protein